MEENLTDLFTRTVLRPAADGTGYELCCPVEHEARIWEHEARIFFLLGRILRIRESGLPGKGYRGGPD